MFRKRKNTDARYVTRFESADSGLHFEARIGYSWQQRQAPLLCGGEAARTLIRETAVPVCHTYPVLLTAEAQDAVNARMDGGIREDPRLLVHGEVQLTVAEHTRQQALRRTEAAEAQRLREAAETARLEAVRERLTDRRLGPVAWAERYADLQFATGDPASKMRSVLAAYDAIAQWLRSTDSEPAGPPGGAALRARASELIAVLEDPARQEHAAQLLDAALSVFQPKPDRQGGTGHQPVVKDPADP
ncbi:MULTISPECIES: hypothetical protein [Streptomyces]|uniref:hypothetical protein n=1 Tax=Streptomyces TaxID=1883 RepID=UPI0004CA035E|nr:MULTISPECIES: hypothetical protein [Streptomyces]